MTASSPALRGLDPEQVAAVTAPAGPLAVIAGAGTGKTTAISRRIAYRCDEEGIEPRVVLAVTHSNKAAGELRDRLFRLGVAGVTARTFHSAALGMLGRFWAATGRDRPLSVLDSKYPLVRAVAERGGGPVTTDLVFDLAAEVGWAKSRLLTPADYPAAASGAGRALPAAAADVAEVFAAYEQEKDRIGQLDFEDLLTVAADLIDGDPVVGALVRDDYHVFVVDEYQDTDPAQERYLRSLLGRRDDLTVVGDPRQAIYSFKGADPGTLATFTTRFPHATVVRLVRDYRSTPEVVALANRLAAGPASEALVGQQGNGPPPRTVGVADEGAEERHLVREVRRLLADGTPAGEIAVLYRFNSQSARFEAALGAAGVPYTVADTERFFERPEITTPLRAYGHAARTTPAEPGLELLTRVLTDAGFDPAAPPPGAGAARSRWEAQAALLEVLAGIPGGDTMDALTLLGEVNHRARESHAPTSGGVTLSTLHKAKGLEYDAVFLVGLVEGALPSSYAKTPDQIDEERRLLYVGITRARRHLWLSWSGTRPGPRGQTWSARPSRFLDDLVAHPSPPARGGGTSGRNRRRRAGGSSLAPGPKSDAACAACGEDLKGIAARRLGRCSIGCLGGEEAALAERLARWRTETAGSLGMEDRSLASDRALLSLVSAPPANRFDLETVAGLDKVRLGDFAPGLLAVLAAR